MLLSLVISFNSSVGILVVRTICPRPPGDDIYRFQFLGRNSGRSDAGDKLGGFADWKFQFLGRNSGRSDLVLVIKQLFGTSVSIPRSEFWSFGPVQQIPDGALQRRFNSSVGILVVRTQSRRLRLARSARFNSSVGILVVRTAGAGITSSVCFMFQFLGRNSGRSDAIRGVDGAGNGLVSIPRSEFWSFGPQIHRWLRALLPLFQFLGRNSGRSD